MDSSIFVSSNKNKGTMDGRFKKVNTGSFDFEEKVSYLSDAQVTEMLTGEYDSCQDVYELAQELDALAVTAVTAKEINGQEMNNQIGWLFIFY